MTRRPLRSSLLALLVLGCSGGEPTPIVPAGPYWAPVDDFFDGAVGWEPVAERADHPVRMRVRSALPFLEPGGYDLPFLEMAPPAEVRFELPEELGALRFEASTGASTKVGAETACTVRFEIRVEGAPAVTVDRTWTPDQTPAERQWQPFEPIELPPGAVVSLRTTLVDGPADPFLEVGFARPRILQERERPAPRPGVPNIVFVLMDTLRRDKLTVYGGADAPTPNLERLADDGTVFDDAYSTASWTWPATASLLTGLLPEEHGVTTHTESYLHNRAQTLPELLREAGYVTGGFSTNPLIDVAHNYDQGFDTFQDPTWLFDPTQEVEGGIRTWLREHADRRFFLYLHLVDPHVPYEPLPRFAGGEPLPPALERPNLPMELRDHLIEKMAADHDSGRTYAPGNHLNLKTVRTLEGRYDRCVQSADHWVGEFQDELDALGLLDETVFVFTSDHGEEFLEHGLLAHASSLHRELTNVPLIVAGPGWAAGRRVERTVSNRHLAPTLLRLAGADPDRLGQLGGSDAIDLRSFDRIPEQPAFFSTTTGVWNGRRGTTVFGMRAADWLVHVWQPPEGEAEWETRLFDLARDPAALVDVAAERPSEAATLQAIVLERLERSRAHFEAAGDVGSIGPGEDGMQLLRSIGYVGEDE